MSDNSYIKQKTRVMNKDKPAKLLEAGSRSENQQEFQQIFNDKPRWVTCGQ